MSYKEQRELEGLPELIEELESEQQQLHQKLADPAFYRQAGAEMGKVSDQLAEIEAQLHAAYSRWETLEAIERVAQEGA